MEWAWVIIIALIIVCIILFRNNRDEYVSPIPGKTVWLLWLQGWDTAPWLVKKVAESWTKLNPTWNIELVDSNNLKNYVNIPYINRIDSAAAKSDVIRLSLLATHGGVWADSTLLCMHSLDEWVYDALEPVGFWMYHGRDEGKGPASWFIISTVSSYLIQKWKSVCDVYWSERTVEDEYFWMDALFANLMNSDPKFIEEWKRVPWLWCEDPGQSHMLAGKTQSADPELKRILKENPPYVVKLSRGNNGIDFSETMTDSNAYYAIQCALDDNRPPHKLHDMIDRRNDPGYSESIVVVADCGNMDDINTIRKTTDNEVIVYDKCNFCKTCPGGVKCCPRKNVGREQETWLYFITKNYDRLPKDIIFLPTPLSKHSRQERFEEILKTGKNKYHDGLTIESEENFELPTYEGRQVTRAGTFPFRAWYEEHIGTWDPTQSIVWNGLFKTSRDRLLEKSLNFFKNLHIQTHAGDDLEVSHFLERSMPAIY